MQPLHLAGTLDGHSDRAHDHQDGKEEEHMKCPSCAANAGISSHESTPTLRVYRCTCGNRIAVKTGWGKAAEFSGLLLVAVSILRVVIDHHGILDFLDDGS